MRLLSVPHDHPYVLRVTAAQEVTVLGDPTDRGDGPFVLDPDWFAAHAHRVDVVHVHFGFERLLPDELRAWLDAVAASGTPLVQTVHDLRNPHLEDNTRQERLLDVMVPAVDEVVTLTHAAAAEIEQRWGRGATVLTHPHVAPVDWLRRATDAAAAGPAGRRTEPRVGLHLKSLRTNFAPRVALEALGQVRALCPQVAVDLRLHNDVDRGPLRALTARVERAGDAPMSVLVSDYLSDDDLCRWIASLDVLLLPYRFGTHSGWIELAKDLGTAVVAPDLPTYVEQGATTTFPVPGEAPTAAGMRDAVVTALQCEVAPPDAGRRLQHAADVAEAHADLYRGLADGAVHHRAA